MKKKINDCDKSKKKRYNFFPTSLSDGSSESIMTAGINHASYWPNADLSRGGFPRRRKTSLGCSTKIQERRDIIFFLSPSLSNGNSESIMTAGVNHASHWPNADLGRGFPRRRKTSLSYSTKEATGVRRERLIPCGRE